MDKIFSVRLDEDLIRHIDRFAKSKSISKKELIDTALRAYMRKVDVKTEHALVDRTFGAWKREEHAQETWENARQTFNKALSRHREGNEDAR
jgi:predicted transcriptional regulator